MSVSLVWLSAAAMASASSPLNVSARIDASGSTAAIIVEYTWADGFVGEQIKTPIVQVAVPKGAKLKGDVLSGRRALSRNEFMRAPYEVVLKESPTRIEFEVVSTPADGAKFELNILAYASGSAGHRFVRHRLAVPFGPGAKSTATESTRSTWGDDTTLQLGDPAAAFSLSSSDGSTVNLADYLGKKNIIVTTYRAHW
jgi:hypothetical protein